MLTHHRYDIFDLEGDDPVRLGHAENEHGEETWAVYDANGHHLGQTLTPDGAVKLLRVMAGFADDDQGEGADGPGAWFEVRMPDLQSAAGDPDGPPLDGHEAGREPLGPQLASIALGAAALLLTELSSVCARGARWMLGQAARHDPYWVGAPWRRS